MNIQYFKFEKEHNGEWYIVLPTWTGPKEDLQMVMGADTMLDIIAQGEQTVELSISTTKFDGFKFKLVYFRDEADGGWYDLRSEHHNFEVWLCKVTKFVFGDLPKEIYVA